MSDFYYRNIINTRDLVSHSKIMTTTSIGRRTFIKATALLTGGMLLSCASSASDEDSGLKSDFDPNPFLRISTDNAITIILSKVEMGQGVWTTLPMLLAEELDCHLNQITVEHSPADKRYYHTYIPGQLTVGSSSVASEFNRYRLAGATARQMLINAAAKKLGVNPATCQTEGGYVISGTTRLSYGDLSTLAAAEPTPEVTLRDKKQWKLIGKSQSRLDGPSKATGKAEYGIDFEAPGLLTALILHPPSFGATVKYFDATKTRQIDGVVDVVAVSNGVAVVATTFWSAKLGRDALKVEWTEKNFTDTSKLRAEYHELLKTRGTVVEEKGSIQTGLQKSKHTIDVEYSVPFLVHAPMEPLNCSVRISKEKCEIWTGTQALTGDQNNVASVLGLRPDQITITVPFLGGGFGRRACYSSDWVVEAVEIAKATGKFIKLIWTREDDIKGGYYRPMMLHRAIIGLNDQGFPEVWQHRVVGQGMMRNFIPDKTAPDLSIVEGIHGSPYSSQIRDVSIELHETFPGVPVLPWRSVGKSHTCFVLESLIDEIASLRRQDPLSFRKELLKEQPRYLAVLNEAEKKSNWESPLEKGKGRGVAVYFGNGTYIAYVAEISILNQQLLVHRVTAAVDCGLIINPDGVKAQIEGSIIFAMGMLTSEITMTNGRVDQSNFHDYKIPRLADCPQIEISFIEGSDEIGGAGEPGVPPLVPAVTNAIFQVTGKRVRSLPLRSDMLEVG